MLDLDKNLHAIVQDKVDEYAKEILRIFQRITSGSEPEIPKYLHDTGFRQELKWGSFGRGDYLHAARVDSWWDFGDFHSHSFDTSAKGVMFTMSFLHLRFQGEVYDIYVRVDENGCCITDNHEYYGKLGDLKIDIPQETVDQLLSEAEKLLEFHLDRVDAWELALRNSPTTNVSCAVFYFWGFFIWTQKY